MIHRDVCPVCSCPQASLARKGIFDSTSSLDQLRDSWINFSPKGHFDYYKCADCKSLFNRTYLGQDFLRRLYNELDGNMLLYAEESNLDATQISYWGEISGFLSKTKIPQRGLKVLEVGADEGKLVKAALTSGTLIRQYDCIEPNKQSHSALKKSLSNASIKTSIFEDLTQLSSSDYDLIIGIHVLDHIPDLSTYFNALTRHLSSNGTAVFLFHDPNSALAKVLRRFWPPYCAQHPQLITEKGIERLASSNGMKLARSAKSANVISLSQVLAMTPFRESKYTPFGFMHKGIRVKLGNHIFFFQPK